MERFAKELKRDPQLVLRKSGQEGRKRPVSHACRFAAMVGYNPAQGASR
jgi:hypothetical protein